MLLPSAFTCPQPRRAPLPPSLFTSPPDSPPTSATTTTTTTHSTLLATCYALQNMLTSPPTTTTTTTTAQATQLPTPPMRHAPLPSPMKLRLRSSTSRSSTASAPAPPSTRAPRDASTSTKSTSTSTTTTTTTTTPSKPLLPRKRVVKRALKPPTGAGPGKRRRGTIPDDEDAVEVPRTPKRVRGVPALMPFGLARVDFERLHDAHQYSSGSSAEADALGIVGGPVCGGGSGGSGGSGLVEGEGGGEGDGEVAEVDNEAESQDPGLGEEGEWTDEEDRVLVELVLQKLRLSRREWMDCARMVGRDRGSVGRRWRSLVGGGEVGLKRKGRERGGLPGTWR